MIALRKFLRDKRGVGAIEFALTAPILILMYLGGYQLMDAISASRKVTLTAKTLADVSSQYVSLTKSQVTTIMNASQQVLTPYSSINATTRVSQIYIDKTGTPTVSWSVSSANTPLTNGDLSGKNPRINVPQNIRTPDTYLIYSEIGYLYTPPAGTRLLGQLNFNDEMFMGPRRSPSIPCSDC